MWCSPSGTRHRRASLTSGEYPSMVEEMWTADVSAAVPSACGDPADHLMGSVVKGRRTASTPAIEEVLTCRRSDRPDRFRPLDSDRRDRHPTGFSARNCCPRSRCSPTPDRRRPRQPEGQDASSRRGAASPRAPSARRNRRCSARPSTPSRPARVTLVLADVDLVVRRRLRARRPRPDGGPRRQRRPRPHPREHARRRQVRLLGLPRPGGPPAGHARRRLLAVRRAT